MHKFQMRNTKRYMFYPFLSIQPIFLISVHFAECLWRLFSLMQRRFALVGLVVIRYTGKNWLPIGLRGQILINCVLGAGRDNYANNLTLCRSHVARSDPIKIITPWLLHSIYWLKFSLDTRVKQRISNELAVITINFDNVTISNNATAILLKRLIYFNPSPPTLVDGNYTSPLARTRSISN